MRGVQVKLSECLRVHAIPERLTGVCMTRHYTNPCLPYLTLTVNIYCASPKADTQRVSVLKFSFDSCVCGWAATYEH